jgi:hypothetical protein
MNRLQHISICTSWKRSPVDDIWPRVNQALCEAWGLDPMQVTGIFIAFSPGTMPEATISMKVNERVMQQVMKLVPRDEIGGT